MTINTVEVVAGQPQTKRLEVTIDVDLEVADLLSRQRAGAQGQDLWIVARTIGNVGLFPLVTAGLQPTDLPALVSTFDLTGKGEPAMAFTNAIFVDVDGNGWKAPFAP